MSEHKPLGFIKDNENWYDVANSYGAIIGAITRIKGRDGSNTHEFRYNGFSSERLLELAVKIEELNNVTKAHAREESQEQSSSQGQSAGQ